MYIGGWAFSYGRGTPVVHALARGGAGLGVCFYRGTSLIRNRTHVGLYSRTIYGRTAVLGGGHFLMSEVPLYLVGRDDSGHPTRDCVPS